MDASNFITKLKANGSKNDWFDLEKIISQYKDIAISLSKKDKAVFSLNVLCTLCRNLEKIPSWSDKINNKDLLTLSIDCVRQTRDLPHTEQVKTLACIFHIHRYAVKQNALIPPELVLKLSYMPFEREDLTLLKEYYKTYWGILADRFGYIEKLKTKLPISKLLPNLLDHIIKVINIYDPVQYCTNILVFVVKKIYFLYPDSPDELNKTFEKIFNAISNSDLNGFKSLSDDEYLDIYVKFNDCLFIILDNDIKCKTTMLETVVRNCLSLFVHNQEIYHCFQTFYLNAFCCIFNKKTKLNCIENVFNNLISSLENTSRLGYKVALKYTYPFLSQFLRIYIENYTIDDKLKINCLEIMIYLVDRLKSSKPISKCENCNIKSSYHDGIRLLFLTKNFINHDVSKEILPQYYTVVKKQYAILSELKSLGCGNIDKYFRRLQTDIHNTAILLYKAQQYDISMKLFDIYLKSEFKCLTKDSDLKNISRALYNRGICELDCKLYDNALKNTYLSLIFALPDGLNSDKYMSLIMDIKAKILKDKTDDSKYQMLSILEACNQILRDNIYGNLLPFFKKLKFCELLRHEFKMYAQIWPSIAPIAGVWQSLNNMLLGKCQNWIPAEDEDIIRETLCDVVLETSMTVRTIHDDVFKDIVLQLVQRFRDQTISSVKKKLTYASLLFLKAEYDLADASQKYGWKTTEHTIDPDQDQSTRTIEQEHIALTAAFQAVDIWTDVLPSLTRADTAWSGLSLALHIAEVFVAQMLYSSRTACGLQLALVCCAAADAVGDRISFIRNASVLIYNAWKKEEIIDKLIARGSKCLRDMMKDIQTAGVALDFACTCAIYHAKCGFLAISCRLVRLVQEKLFVAMQDKTNTQLDIAVGRLLEAEYMLCLNTAEGPAGLTALNTLHRHYLSLANSESGWCNRRRTALTLKHRISVSGAACVRLSCGLLLLRRAKAAVAATLPRTAAASQARMIAAITNTHADDAQIKIDNRLKYILGLQPFSDIQQNTQTNKKIEVFTPRNNLETMLECFKRTQISPSLPCITIPAFHVPDFLKHESCTCYACSIPDCAIVACQIAFLEASMYYRAKEFDIAKNYFNGTLKCFELAETKIKSTLKNNSFNKYICNNILNICLNELKTIEIECLIELSYFELSQDCHNKADENIIKLHEILKETQIDGYLQNEIANLMITAARLRMVLPKPINFDLNDEFENLKITDIPKTPITKFIPKVETVKIVKDEEIPKRIKVIKLNLDEPVEEETKEKVKKPKFKVPVPVIAKPNPEIITPRPTRTKPNILIQDLDETPQSKFFTPSSTPKEEFFTPMTSVKTYSRRVVKNLENEFATPKNETKERSRKVETGSLKLKDKRSLKRATSPGKLDDKSIIRTRRRQPLNDK